MCAERDTFGVDEVVKAAYKVSCRCGDDGCVLPPQPGDVVRYRSPGGHLPTDTERQALADRRYRIEDIVAEQSEPKVSKVESDD